MVMRVQFWATEPKQLAARDTLSTRDSFFPPHVTMQHPRVLCRVQSAQFFRDIQSHIPGVLHIGRDRTALFQ